MQTLSGPMNRTPAQDFLVVVLVAASLALLTATAVRLSSAEAERERTAYFALSAERVGHAVRGELLAHLELVERWRNVLAVSPEFSKAQLDSLFQGARQRQVYAGIGPVVVAAPASPGTPHPQAGGTAQRPFAVAYSFSAAGPSGLAGIDLAQSQAFVSLSRRPAGEQQPALLRLREFDADAAAVPALVVPVKGLDGKVGCWIIAWIDFTRLLERVGTQHVPEGFAVSLRQPSADRPLGGWSGIAGIDPQTPLRSSGVPEARYSNSLMEFSGEPIEIAITGREDRLIAPDGEWPTVFALAGAVLTLLGAWLAYWLLRRRREAGHAQAQLAGALQAGEQRFRDLVETTPDWVWETDGEGVYTYSSPSCAALFGYAPGEIVGTRGELIWGAGIPAHAASGVRLRVARHRSGKHITLESSSVPIRNADGEDAGLRGFDRDASRRVALEEELRLLQSQLIGATQAQSVGQAMVGLAHELNQPLAAVVTYNQACLRMVEADPSIDPDIREAMRATANHALLASDIVRKYRALAGGGRITRSWIRIEEVVKHALDIAATRRNREKIRVNLDIAPDLPDVSGDATLLVQVVLNLLNNAMDAVARARIREITIRAHSDEAGKVRLEVIDTGSGLSEVARTQMFEPYFSTKVDGVGMGLSVSRSIVEAHGEEIEAGTTDDGRTAFWFTLAARETEHA